MAMIFAAFGWPWTPGDVAKLSRNVNDRAKVAPPPSSAGNVGGEADAASAKAAEVKAKAAKAEKKANDPLAALMPRIAEANARDVELYAEARRRYDERKAQVLAAQHGR